MVLRFADATLAALCATHLCLYVEIRSHERPDSGSVQSCMPEVALYRQSDSAQKSQRPHMP
eukprot:6462332-Amphidinium_carterae.1